MSLPAVLQSASAGQATANATTRAATFSSSVTVGSSIVALTISRYQITSVTDSKSNTYTKVAEKGASGAYLALWLSANVATGGSSFTVTATSGTFSGPIELAIQELDKYLQFISAQTTGLSTSLSPFVPATSYPPGSYAVAAFMATMAATPITSSPSGWQPRVTRADTVQLGEALDRVFADLSVTAPAWQIGGARSWVTLGAIFLEKLQANFTGTPTSGAATLSVAFTDSSTGSPSTWAWNFGDGGTSSTQNPSHDYTAAGTYTVTLSVTNGASISSFTRSAYITVGAGGGSSVTPTTPGIPNSPVITFGPPIPGAPWAAQSMIPPPPEPPPPVTTTTAPPSLLLVPPAKSEAQQERENRILALFFNALSRAKIIVRTGKDQYGVRTSGFASDRDPTESDDATIGARVGVVWVNQEDETAFYCADDTVGAAVWKEISLATVDGVTGGLSGTFPG